MKKFIKFILAEIVYLPYKYRIIKNPIRVNDVDETLEELIHTKKSLVRFGDGEIVMIRGKNLQLQDASPKLIEGLKRILSYQYDNLIVSVPGIFDGVEKYGKSGRKFWKDHLLFCRKIYLLYCNLEKTYANASVTRCYYSFHDKSRCREWFEKFKEIWDNKEIVIVEGTRTHNGIGNDLFDKAASIERVICPPQNAFSVYDAILKECQQFSKNKLFLVSLGVTAKFLTEDLFLLGYRVIDIGNLDMEYEWFLKGAADKPPIKKHSVIGMEANMAEGYENYWKQIVARIELGDNQNDKQIEKA